MKKFSFKLETLLSIRIREEDKVKEDFAEKRIEIQNTADDFNSLKNELKEFQQSEKEGRANANDVLHLRYSVSYRNQLKLNMLKKGQKIQELEKELDQIQSMLIEATKKRKALEFLKEKKYRAWKKEYNAKEQAFLDDLSGQAYLRKMER